MKTNQELKPMNETLNELPDELWLTIATHLDSDDLSALSSTFSFFASKSKEDKFHRQWLTIKQNNPSILCASSNLYTLIYINKTLFVTGMNSYGELGLGHYQNQKHFVECKLALNPHETLLQLVTGENCSYFVTSHNRVFACGRNDLGRLGVGNTDNMNSFTQCKIALRPDESIKAMTANNRNAFVVSNQNRLFVCGASLKIADDKDFSPLFIEHKLHLNPEEIITNIAAGVNHGLITTNQNRLLVWGLNKFGQLGNQSYDNSDDFIPCFLPLLQDEYILDIAAGSSHSLVLTSQNRLLVCGQNCNSQLGLGNKPIGNLNRFVECTIALAPGELISSLATNYRSYSSHLITNQNRLLVCGNNALGNIGLQNITGQTTFVAVEIPLELGETIKFAIGGYFSTQVVTNQKRIYVCGNNQFGRMGLGDKTTQASFSALIHNKTTNTLAEIEQTEDVLIPGHVFI